MKEIVFRGKKIYYHAEGKGKLVILIHGFAEDSQIWKPQVTTLKEDFLIIIPDLPGSGKSEMLEGDISIDDYAEAIKAIADNELANNNENAFTIIGHSMGGYIVLAFAEKYPEILNGLGLFHSTAYADDEAKKETRRKGIEFIKNNGTELFLKTTTPNLFSENIKNEAIILVENLINEYKDFPANSLIQYYNAMMQRPDRMQVLRSFANPILFIIGKNDRAVSLQYSLEQCHLPFLSHIYILNKSAHMGMWEESEKSTAFLKNFLDYLNFPNSIFTK